nr:substrate-binding domain-containing protein [Phycisphaerae bacterium]
EDYLDDFRARGVDGLISIFHNHPAYRKIVEPELLSFKNVVFYERPGDCPAAKAEGPCYVEADFPAVSRISVEHLIERGRRRIGLVLANVSFPYALQRRSAHMKTLVEAGLAADEALVWILDERTPANWTQPFTPELAARAVEDLVAGQGVDAIAAVNDLYAARLMAAVRRSGRRVPDDIAIVGCDNLEIGTLVEPPLTTVDLNVEALARAMVTMLLELLEHGTVPPDRRAVVIAPELVARAST